MKILLVSSEIYPFAKTGGLADVCGALPKAINQLGHDVRLIMPLYKSINREKYGLKAKVRDLPVRIGEQQYYADIYEARLPGSLVPVYFVEHELFFGNRDGLYQENGQDYPDNCKRFSFFNKAVLEFTKNIEWRFDILHANDWQAALAIAYLKLLCVDDHFFRTAAAVYSIHNMGYMGLFPKDKLLETGLDWEQFTFDKLEFWDQLALSKGGIVYADVINTVSEQYAKEIQTPEYGCGLEGLLRSRSKDVYGILNGLDYAVWDPAKDAKIARRYNENTLSLKVHNKLALQSLCDIPMNADIPLIGMVSRLDRQKGFDILAEIISQIMAMNVNFVLLGTGDPEYHRLFQDLKKKYPEKIGLNLGFDAALAQVIYAGADMFLMPSKYEPCGLGQLISFKYGTVPIVRKTGGLADTVKDYNLNTGEGDGFVFEEYSSAALLLAIRRALSLSQDQGRWQMLMKKIMKYNYSWENSAKKYIALYKKARTKT